MIRTVAVVLLLAVVATTAQPTAEELENQCLAVCDTAQESCPLHDVRCEDQCNGASNTTIENTTALRDAIAGASNDAHKAFFCSTMLIASGGHVTPTLSVPVPKTTTTGYTMAIIFIAIASVIGLAILWYGYKWCQGDYNKMDGESTEDGVELVKNKSSSKRGRSRNGR
jgi:hypothetical protein